MISPKIELRITSFGANVGLSKKFPLSRMLRTWTHVVSCLFVLLFGLSSAAYAQSWMNPAWQNRSVVSVTNPNGSTLTNFQVKVTLDASFDFAHAQSNGADLRVTTSDGVSTIPFWIADWRPANSTATFWVMIPSIPSGGTTIWLYYGNSSASSVSSGRSTFSFFDDFEPSATSSLGYFPLSAPQTVLVQSSGLIAHTLSVVQANSGGFPYAGYVGSSTCGGIGITRSSDLSSWQDTTRLTSLPADARWPSVLLVNGRYYMLYEANYCSVSSIALATSTDGINFSTVKTIVALNGNLRNQNPNLFFNPNDQRFYIYWFHDEPTGREIRARSATTPEGLSDTSTEVVVLRSPTTMASPNMLFTNGLYLLSTEQFDSNGLWATKVFYSTSPTGGFQAVANSPLLTGGNACMFQHVFNNVLHAYTCTVDGSRWIVTHRTAPLSFTNGIDPTLWGAPGDSWSLITDSQQNGIAGRVLLSNLSSTQSLSSSFTGTDYVLEGYGRQISGRVWGLGVHANSANASFYSASLYSDLGSTNNLYTYRWLNGATGLASAAVGPIQNGAWYNLSIKIHSNQIDVYKDGVLRSQSFDGAIPSGGVSLYGENGTLAEFNNVFVRRYAASDPTAFLGSGSQGSPPPPPPPPPPSSGRVNVAAAAAGATPNASSFYDSRFPPSGAINGDRRGTSWGSGGGWNDVTANAFPDWLQIDFAGTQTINEVDVFTVQDNYNSPVEPFLGMPFTLYGITSFQVQYWNGSTFVDVPGGNISGNNQIWRQIVFSPITTPRIRVVVNGALNTYSRITEIEAYSDSASVPGPVNVAAAVNGGNTSVSSFYNSGFAAAGALDGDRRGAAWGNGGGWNDGTQSQFPDWLQINFAGAKTISEIDVFTVQDNFPSPINPTQSTTFSLYGITDFQVQYWDGSQFLPVPNGTINGNNLVWRKITFPSLTTVAIRILVTGALNSWSRIVEVEAY